MLNTLIQVIKQHLATERRLVVPRLGVFLVKDDHTILFSELMRRDDEVLRKLLVKAGMNELAAVGAIDRLIFEVHQAVEEHKPYQLPGFGRFEAGPNSTICFYYAAPQVAVAQPAAEVEPEVVALEMPVAAAVTEPVAAPAVEVAEPVYVPSTVEEEVVAADEAPVVAEPEAEAQTPTPKSYDGYEDEYEDDYEEQDRAIARSMRKGSNRRRQQRKSGPDRFVVAALVAVLLALAAIAFGYYCEWSEAQQSDQTIYESQTTLTDGAGDNSDF